MRARKSVLAAAAVALCVFPAAAAADAPAVGMVKKIGGSTKSSTPRGYVEAGGVVYFTADDGSGHATLWRVDESTSCLTAVRLAISSNLEDMSDLTATGDRAFFVADGQLWTSDGTAEGTVQLTQGGSDAGHLMALGDELYFTYATDDEGSELWKSDGTRSRHPAHPGPDPG